MCITSKKKIFFEHVMEVILKSHPKSPPRPGSEHQSDGQSVVPHDSGRYDVCCPRGTGFHPGSEERAKPVNSINAFIIQELRTHSSHMRLDIVTHQREPTAHRTSIWSESESEDLTSAVQLELPHRGLWEGLSRSLIQDQSDQAGVSCRQQNILRSNFEWVASAQHESELICEEDRPSVTCS